MLVDVKFEFLLMDLHVLVYQTMKLKLSKLFTFDWVLRVFTLLFFTTIKSFSGNERSAFHGLYNHIIFWMTTTTIKKKIKGKSRKEKRRDASSSNS